MADEITYGPVSNDELPTMGVDPGGEDEVFIKAGSKSGRYSRKTIQSIVSAAKATGVDPGQALALALQESGFGTAMVKGRRGKIAASLGQINDFSDSQQAQLDALSQQTGIDPEALKLTIALRDKLAYAKQLGFNTEPSMLQAYNGYGTITPASFGGATTAYGVDITNGINLKQNPLYGKRLVQLKSDLLANDYINSLLK